MEDISSEVRLYLSQEVQHLAVQLGDIHRSWQLHNVTTTKWADIYRIEILIDGAWFLQGVAFVFAPYVVDIMLNAHSLYGWLNGRMEERLQQYSRENPWLLGI